MYSKYGGLHPQSPYSAFLPVSFARNFLGWKGGYFSRRERSNFLGGVTGIWRQITARTDPVKAIHTTLTADGTRAA